MCVFTRVSRNLEERGTDVFIPHEVEWFENCSAKERIELDLGRNIRRLSGKLNILIPFRKLNVCNERYSKMVLRCLYS